MKSAIHALKYGRIHPVAPRLGAMLAHVIAEQVAEAQVEMLVVPVPLHRSKQTERGFNQARTLAVYALRALGKSNPEWKLTLASSTLMRLRVTASQAGLNPRQRRANVRGAFSVADRATVRDKHILLVDDIFTTGATARAASQALMRAGAASVRVATLARARKVYGPGTHGFGQEGGGNDLETPPESGIDFLEARPHWTARTEAHSSQGQPSF